MSSYERALELADRMNARQEVSYWLESGTMSPAEVERWAAQAYPDVLAQFSADQPGADETVASETSEPRGRKDSRIQSAWDAAFAKAAERSGTAPRKTINHAAAWDEAFRAARDGA